MHRRTQARPTTESSQAAVMHFMSHRSQPIPLPACSGSAAAWTHCQWPTAYGPLQLNLQGITSRQARIAARALSGHEAACWRDAAGWLERLEEDAYRAAELAELARRRWSQGDRAGALQAARTAVRIERQYRPDSNCESLYKLLYESAR